MIRKALFVLRLAGQDIKGNLAVHLVAAAVISAAFLTVGVFILIASNLQVLAEHWEEKIQLCVYLADGITEGEPKDLRSKLEALSGVTMVEYVSKEQALADFKVMLGPDADLIRGLDGNPLPASFTLRLAPEARTYEAVKKLAAELAAWPGVEEVDYGGTWIESFASAAGFIKAAVFLVGALIVAAVVFIISNTIRLTMYSRKEEIGIMKLVGASNILIRLPFVLEGMIQGGLASSIGVLLLYTLFRLGVHGLSLPGVFSGFTPVFISAGALLAMIGGGAALGAAGSMSRFSDFLRV